MNEQTKQLLSEYLTKLLHTLEAGATWTAEQVPLVVQEKLAFDFWWAIGGVVLGLLLSLAPIPTWRLTRNWEDEDARGTIRFLGTAIPVVVSTIFLITNVYTLLHILVAPRLYVLEWLRTLVG